MQQVADARGDGVATSELRLLLAVVLGPTEGGGAGEARRGDVEEDVHGTMSAIPTSHHHHHGGFQVVAMTTYVGGKLSL